MEDPAEGKVREMVEVREDGSVTMVNPVGRVVMEGVRDGGEDGLVAGRLRGAR